MVMSRLLQMNFIREEKHKDAKERIHLLWFIKYYETFEIMISATLTPVFHLSYVDLSGCNQAACLLNLNGFQVVWTKN